MQLAKNDALRQLFGVINATQSTMKPAVVDPTPVAFGRHF
jgi:hypothetical protein